MDFRRFKYWRLLGVAILLCGLHHKSLRALGSYERLLDGIAVHPGIDFGAGCAGMAESLANLRQTRATDSKIASACPSNIVKPEGFNLGAFQEVVPLAFDFGQVPGVYFSSFRGREYPFTRAVRALPRFEYAHGLRRELHRELLVILALAVRYRPRPKYKIHVGPLRRVQIRFANASRQKQGQEVAQGFVRLRVECFRKAQQFVGLQEPCAAYFLIHFEFAGWIVHTNKSKDGPADFECSVCGDSAFVGREFGVQVRHLPAGQLVDAATVQAGQVGVIQPAHALLGSRGLLWRLVALHLSNDIGLKRCVEVDGAFLGDSCGFGVGCDLREWGESIEAGCLPVSELGKPAACFAACALDRKFAERAECDFLRLAVDAFQDEERFLPRWRERGFQDAGLGSRNISRARWPDLLYFRSVRLKTKTDWMAVRTGLASSCVSSVSDLLALLAGLLVVSVQSLSNLFGTFRSGSVMFGRLDGESKIAVNALFVKRCNVL